MDIVSVLNTLTPGIQTRFTQMYGNAYTQVRAELEPCMEFAVPSTGAYEIYAGFRSAPHAIRWPRGATRRVKGFDSWTNTVVNHDWQNGVRAHENDLADDRTSSLESRAAVAGMNMGRLAERIFFQLEESITNVDLLPAIPNAPDGAALFSATDGAGDARFGVTGGNIITGTGVATPSAIQTDYASALVRARQFLDTEGQPYYGADILKNGITIVAAVTNQFVFDKAFEQKFNVVVVQNVAAAENVAAAAQSNPVQDAGRMPVRILLSPYKTTNDWSIWFHGAPIKPIFQQYRQALQMIQANRTNSDRCRNEKLVEWLWDERAGYGLNFPIGCIQVNN
jgi:phage major head subunit gpT-like protein